MFAGAASFAAIAALVEQTTQFVDETPQHVAFHSLLDALDVILLRFPVLPLVHVGELPKVVPRHLRIDRGPERAHLLSD